jgi:hypothetical protein
VRLILYQFQILYLRTPSSLERGEMAYDGRRIEPSCLSSSGPAASKDKKSIKGQQIREQRKISKFYNVLFYYGK